MKYKERKDKHRVIEAMKSKTRSNENWRIIEKRLIVMASIVLITMLISTIQVQVQAQTQKPEHEYNQYSIDLSLNTKTNEVNGNLALNYTNKADITFDDLYFHIYPNAFKCIGGYTKIYSVKQDSVDLKYEISGNDSTSTILRVRLARPLEPKERTTIQMNFTIVIPHVENRFGWMKGTYNLGNALPIISVWDKEDGWNNDPYYHFGESFNSEFSFYDVNITVPEDFTVATTGSCVETTYNYNSDGNGTKTKTKTCHCKTDLVREFVIVASNRYEVSSDTWNGIKINSYYFSEHEEAGIKALNIAKRAIKHYSEHFGMYPYKEYGVAETYFLPCGMILIGGMEYPNLVMIGEGCYKGGPGMDSTLEMLIAHETAHQWWYCSVGTDENDEPWLDEAFAVYSEMLYQGWEHGEQSEDSRISTEKTNYYAYNNFGGKEYPPAGDVWSFQNPISYQIIIYSKGSCILDMLRHIVGDETFSDILQTFFENYKFKLTRIDDFIRTSEEVSGQNLDWFFDEWLYGTGYTTYAIEDAYAYVTQPNGEYNLIVNITQSDPSFKMPVPLEINLSNSDSDSGNMSKCIDLDIWVDKGRETFEFSLSSKSKPLSVIVDPDDVIIGLDENNEMAVKAL